MPEGRAAEQAAPERLDRIGRRSESHPGRAKPHHKLAQRKGKAQIENAPDTVEQSLVRPDRGFPGRVRR